MSVRTWRTREELEALSIGPDVRFEEAEKRRSRDCGLEKLDLGSFHVLEKYELFQKQARTEFAVELFSATSMMSVGVASWRLWKDVPMFTGAGSLSGMGETGVIGFLLALLIGVVAGLRAMTAPAVVSRRRHLARLLGL